MEQRTPEWHEARRTRITASEAGSLLGLNPYTSAKAARKAWIAKYRGAPPKDLSRVPDVQRGVELEAAILDGVEFEYDETVLQDAGREHELWLWASGDGWMDVDPDGRFCVEAKAPRKFFDPSDRPDYLLQLWIQMVAYEADFGVLAQGVEVEGRSHGMGVMELQIESGCYSFDELAAEIDKHTDGTNPLILLKALWEEMVREASEEPQQAAEAPEGFEDASTYYLTAKIAYDEAKARLDEAKAAVLAVTQNSPAIGERLQVIESTRQGGVNYKALNQAHPEIDLDQFRSAPTTYLQIREVKR
jgi:hypothetical protein